MKISKNELMNLSQSLGYRPEVFEKVLMLILLLNEIFKNDFLKDKLVLKGGTALNLFFLDLPRLSVDIDLNYIGAVDKKLMLEERPLIERRIASSCSKLDFNIKKSPGEHAGGKYILT